MRYTIKPISDKKDEFGRLENNYTEALITLYTVYKDVAWGIYSQLINDGLSHNNEMVHGPEDTDSGVCEIVVMEYRQNIDKKSNWIKEVRQAVKNILKTLDTSF